MDEQYLWELLFKYVDIQLELRDRGKLREAVVMRRRCRAIGRAIMKGNDDDIYQQT